MDTLKITITIPRSVAVAAGRSQYGALEYQISDADLASLSVEERAWLNNLLHFDGRMTRSGHGPIPLAVASTTVEWAAVAAALRATMVDDAAWEAEQAAKTEARIQAALALGPQEWLRDDGQIQHWLGSVVAYNDVRTDPRVIQHVAELAGEIALRQQAVEERLRQQAANQESERRRRDEVEAQKEAEKTAAREEIQVFALTIPSLARAAEDGYDVAAAVIEHLVEQLVNKAGVEAVVLCKGSPDWERYGWSERSAPSPEAFALLDRVTDLVDGLAHPACVAVEALRIMRVTVEPDPEDGYGEKERYTGVVVTLESLVTRDCAVVFAAE